VGDLTNGDSRECFPKPKIASKNGKLIVTCPFGLVGFSPGQLVVEMARYFTTISLAAYFSFSD